MDKVYINTITSTEILGFILESNNRLYSAVYDTVIDLINTDVIPEILSYFNMCDGKCLIRFNNYSRLELAYADSCYIDAFYQSLKELINNYNISDISVTNAIKQYNYFDYIECYCSVDLDYIQDIEDTVIDELRYLTDKVLEYLTGWIESFYNIGHTDILEQFTCDIECGTYEGLYYYPKANDFIVYENVVKSYA